MLHLIKLELKKGRFTGYLWGSLIAYAAIAGLMLLLYLVEGNNAADPPFVDLTELLQAIDLFVSATFIIYASVLLSKLIISEFNDKTMALLFAYPVSRKKIIFAKLSMVFFWTFANVLLANLIIDFILLSVNSRVGYLPETLTLELQIQHGIQVLMQAFGAAGMSLLPLVLGIRKKSVAVTIVSSIIVVMIVNSNNMGFSLSSIIAIPISLAILGIFITYMSFRNIDKVDIA
jgi:ABC-type transport system involved in multi-copper enzyme maturation permease subunit